MLSGGAEPLAARGLRGGEISPTSPEKKELALLVCARIYQCPLKRGDFVALILRGDWYRNHLQLANYGHEPQKNLFFLSFSVWIASALMGEWEHTSEVLVKTKCGEWNNCKRPEYMYKDRQGKRSTSHHPAHSSSPVVVVSSASFAHWPRGLASSDRFGQQRRSKTFNTQQILVR